MAPSHCLNQCWLLISEVLWHSPKSNLTVSAQATILYNEFENYTFKITAISPRGQWVKSVSQLSYLYNGNPYTCQPTCVNCESSSSMRTSMQVRWTMSNMIRFSSPSSPMAHDTPSRSTMTDARHRAGSRWSLPRVKRQYFCKSTKK